MYKTVPKIPDFPEMERRHLARWAETDAFAKRREMNRGGEPWSFLDGPITANNPMGVHHAWGRSYKDMFQRYHAMNGRDLRYQNGFDCQGLWVEVEVEKEYGFDTKADIVRLRAGSLRPFLQGARADVRRPADGAVHPARLLDGLGSAGHAAGAARRHEGRQRTPSP